jgi:hypothetical protein
MHFITWINENLPHPNYRGIELDRINNNGHYAPGNLQLATRKEQLANRRNAVFISWKGQKILLVDFPSPLAYGPTYRLCKQGLSGEDIIRHAQQSVTERRKNWRSVKAKLESMTL